MARAKKIQLADDAADTVEYRGADYGMDQADIVDWKKWHTLQAVSVVAEDDDVEAPREIETDPQTSLVEFLQAHTDIPLIDVLASLNLDADSLWPMLKDITASGYALFITDEQHVLFGMTAMAHLYDKIKEKPTVVTKPGRKAEVLALLQSHAAISIPAMAKALGITERNISSQLSYLRADGYLIGTNSRGWKVLEQAE